MLASTSRPRHFLCTISFAIFSEVEVILTINVLTKFYGNHLIEKHTWSFLILCFISCIFLFAKTFYQVTIISFWKMRSHHYQLHYKYSTKTKSHSHCRTDGNNLISTSFTDYNILFQSAVNIFIEQQWFWCLVVEVWLPGGELALDKHISSDHGTRVWSIYLRRTITY